MESSRRNTLMLRWSLLSAAAIGLFWLIYYFIAGEVPVVEEIQMTLEWTFVLPFGVSRWWDVAIGPIWSVMLVLIFTNENVKKDDLVGGLVFGLVGGLVFGLGFGLVFGLGFGLVGGLVGGLVLGLVFGLVLGLGFGLVFGLGFGIFFGIKNIKPAAYYRVGRWLSAADKK